MLKKQLIHKIIASNLCTGCGICQSLMGDENVRIKLNDEGYLRPELLNVVSLSKQNDLEKICPGIYLHQEHFSNTHPIWGPIVNVRTGHAIDPETRYLGSSGGVISAILVHLLETAKIDYVLHIVASEDNPLQNILQVSRTKNDVLSAAGSRYSPSAPLVNIDNYLSSKGSFAIVGKPCDIAALRQYAKLNPLVDQKIKYMISFMCAGIPSIKGTFSLLNELGVSKADLASLSYRGKGWPGLTTAKTKAGKSYSMNYETSWGTILNRHLQFRCKICPDGIGEFADIVCADAWEGKDGYPDFSEKDGSSLIISRTEQGEKVIQEVIGSALSVSTFEVSKLSEIQPYQEKRKMTLLARLIAMRMFLLKIPKYQNMSILKAAVAGGFIMNMKSFLGMARRLCLCRR